MNVHHKNVGLDVHKERNQVGRLESPTGGRTADDSTEDSVPISVINNFTRHGVMEWV